MSEGIIIIKKGREKPIIQQHPWIFSGAIANVENAHPGDVVTVISHQGDILARGYWNQKSQIQVRLLTWQDETIDKAWWRGMLQRAIDGRATQNTLFESGEAIAYRLVNAENDFLPGLIVDRYDNWLVLQALTLYIDQNKAMIAELLAELLEPQGIYERSDVDIRRHEGLSDSKGVLWGDAPPETITITELGEKIQLDVANGHKTGFYLDQAVNRMLVYGLLSDYYDKDECRLLNLFSYTGGFALHGLATKNAYVINVDSSYEALELAEANVKLNKYPLEKAEFIQADVFDFLGDMVEQGEEYDVVILDPPKFAHNKQQIESAARGYKNINLNAFKVIKPGGYLMTFSCSGAIDADLFQKIVFGALADSGRQAQIIGHLGPGDDHPVALTFPEGAYLKGLLLRVY